jgi:hypothetical protein
MYALSTNWRALFATLSEGLQLFQVISVTGDRLAYESRTADGAVIDAFELVKMPTAASRYVNRAPAQAAGMRGGRAGASAAGSDR